MKKISAYTYSKITLGLDPSTVYIGGIEGSPVICFVAGGPEPLGTVPRDDEIKMLDDAAAARIDVLFANEKALDDFIASLEKLVRPEFRLPKDEGP